MSRYIDADAFLKEYCEPYPHVFMAMSKAMAEAPSIDIVRCRECKHWQPHEQYGYDEDNDEYHDYCGLLVPEDDYYAIERRADDFCSYGERQD